MTMESPNVWSINKAGKRCSKARDVPRLCMLNAVCRLVTQPLDPLAMWVMFNVGSGFNVISTREVPKRTHVTWLQKDRNGMIITLVPFCPLILITKSSDSSYSKSELKRWKGPFPGTFQSTSFGLSVLNPPWRSCWTGETTVAAGFLLPPLRSLWNLCQVRCVVLVWWPWDKLNVGW